VRVEGAAAAAGLPHSWWVRASGRSESWMPREEREGSGEEGQTEYQDKLMDYKGNAEVEENEMEV